MITIKLIFALLLGAFMIANGSYHFSKPEMYFPFIPDFLPKLTVNYVSGVIEILLGIGVFIPQTRVFATLGILLMMIAFLPIHLVDACKETPAIGTRIVAIQRLVLQFGFILWAWWVTDMLRK
jgi:uncharacterized membrane protein